MDQAIPPRLTADTTQNIVGQPVELTFADNAAWRQAINDVKVNGEAVDASNYQVQAGKIALDAAAFPVEAGYDITVQAAGYPDATIKQIVTTNSTANLALNKPATTSDNANKAGAFAVDGKADSRWESAFSDPQYITVDLGVRDEVSRVPLNWESAFGQGDRVRCLHEWKEMVESVNIPRRPGMKVSTTSRLCPLTQLRESEWHGRGRRYGYSLWELEVYGTPAGALDAPELTADATMNRAGQPIDIGFDDFADWRTAIAAVNVNGTPVDAGKAQVSPGKITLDGSLFAKAGSYDIAVEAKGFANTAVKQTIVTGSNVNLALRKAATTSDGAKQPGKNAVDGNKNTRWESDFSDPQFIKVDLGAENVISRVLLNWENAAGKSYTVDVSADGKAWKTVYATTNGKPGAIDIGFLPVSARYVKVTGTERTTNYGFSLYEFEVYGDADGLPSAPELNADTTDAVVGQPIVVTFDDDAAWRSAINAVKLDGIAVGAGQYAVTEGNIALNAGLFAKAGAYAITVEAKDYADAAVLQTVAAKNDPNENPGQHPGQDPGHNPDQTNPNPLNLAFNRPTASSPDYHRSSADAVDGRFDRRWESAFADNQWMSVDLGAAKTINRVVLNWENAYGKAYAIDVSENGETWTTVYATENGNGGIDDLSFDPVSARYVKMNGITRGTPYGFSSGSSRYTPATNRRSPDRRCRRTTRITSSASKST